MENNVVEQNKNKKSIITCIIILLIVLVIGLGVYFLFIKKDDSVSDSGNGQINNSKTNNQIEMVQHKRSYVGDLYLDKEGNLYFSLSKDVENNDNLLLLKQKQKKYTNIIKNDIFSDDSINAIILDDDNIDKIDYLPNGQSGMGYFTLLTNDGYLHVISDEQIEVKGILEIIKPSLLFYIKSVGVDTDEEGTSAYAINGYGDKIYIYDAIKNDVQSKQLTKNNQSIKLNNKDIKVKLISMNDGLNGDLYINDKKVATFDYDQAQIYITEKFAVIAWQGGQCRGDVLIGAINENGEYININSNKYVNCYGIHIENGKILAKAQKSNEYDVCGEEEKIELVYDTKTVEMKKAK